MSHTIIRYTQEQLRHLRESPLIQKPDGLPSIEQWMETPADQNNRRPRSGVLRENDAPVNGESRSERPLLINAGSMGHFGRRSSTQPEDTILGPPKLSFTSASRNAKTTDSSEKRTSSTQEGDSSLGDRFSNRWSRDRDTDRNRDRGGYPNGRRSTREEGEGWTNVKSRKSLGQDELDRVQRNGDRDREKSQKEYDNDETGSRRLGMGRDRFDSRWTRREDSGTEKGDNRNRAGGWRDREKERDQDRDRDWNRGASRIEEDPEWMDVPVETEKKQMQTTHTQEDFQRWKDQMKAKNTAVEEKESVQEPSPNNKEQPAAGAIVSNATSSKPATPLAFEGGLDKLFGAWNKEKGLESNDAEGPPTAKVTKGKPKASRFAGLFAPPTEESKQVPLPAAVAAAPSPAPASAPPPTSPTSPERVTNGNSEDKEGFQRILQMLGGASISAPAPQQGTAPPNGTRQGGIPLNLLLQQQTPEDRPDSIPPPRQQIPRTREERNVLPESVFAPRASQPVFSPEPDLSPEQYRLSRPESNRPGEDFPIQPPPRNSSAQEAHSLQALLGRPGNQEQARDSQRDFLLALMQKPSSRGTPPQMGQNMPRQPPENHNFSPFMDMGAQKMQGQSKSRGLPPGAFDAELQRREAQALRESREQQLREAAEREMLMSQAETMRKNSQRLPPGMYPDDPAIAGLQRRSTAENIPRPMTNMGIPQQPVSDMPPYMRNQGIPPNAQDRNIAPPPGFGPGVNRPPPGFGGPPGGPQSQMGPFSAGNTPFGYPGMPGPPQRDMYPGPNQGQIPPGGYFPPGFPQMGPGRGGPVDDPRMSMGRSNYDGYGGLAPPGAAPRPGGRPPGMFNINM